MDKYNMVLPRITYSGVDALENLRQVVAGCKKAAIFTDKGILGAGLVDLPQEIVRSAGVETVILSDIPAEPSYGAVQTLVDEFRTLGADIIIAVGGGSAMDTAKLASILVTDEYTVKDLLDDPLRGKKTVMAGLFRVLRRLPPFVAVPTTAGTGSEATPNAIVAVPEKELKIGIVNPAMVPDYVILDARMIKNLPRKIAAASGVDAMAHAIECFTSNKANPFSDTFALDAFDRILNNIERACDDPEALDAYRKASFSNLEMYWNVVLGFFMTGANTGIKLIYQSMRDEQQMEALKRQNLQAEMDYLKYQINPHFFMNTLNNIHALIDIDTESAKNAVIELSKMMRYVLYESGREIISLNRDIQFLKNYIELMRIRYTDAVNISVESPGNLPEQLSIPPLLLIVFVENAFKHGVSYNHPSFIRLKIEYADGQVTSTLTNSRHAAQSSKHPAGIGLENVRKRLELIYGAKNYSLEIREEEKTYTVKLVIPTLNA